MSDKTIIVYFSATGTTGAVAENIAKYTGAPVVAIEPETPYSAADLDWNDKLSRSSVEMSNDTVRPAVKPVVVNWSDYDTILLGYPIWWDMAPRVINSFIEANNLDGKIVRPFATSGGSSIDNSVRQLKKEYPDLDWMSGYLFNSVSDSAIENWLNQ